MAKDHLTVPLIVQRNEVQYKLLYLQFNPDSSVYVIFPRKKGYKITKDSHNVQLVPGKNVIRLERSAQSDISATPYISFHPGKNTSHINLQNVGTYITDAPVIEMSADIDASIFPLCNITLSDSEFLDQYTKKNDYMHELTFIENDTERDLNIELWLHSSNRRPLIDDLPFYQERAKVQNITDFVTLSDSKLGKYTVSVLVSELSSSPVPDNEQELHGIMISVWRKGRPSFFLLEPSK